MKTLTFRGQNIRVWTFDDASEWFSMNDLASLTQISVSQMRSNLIHVLKQHSIQRSGPELGLIGREAQGKHRVLIDRYAVATALRSVGWPYASLFHEWLRQGCPPDFDSELRSAPHPVVAVLDEYASEISLQARTAILAALNPQRTEP